MSIAGMDHRMVVDKLRRPIDSSLDWWTTADTFWTLSGGGGPAAVPMRSPLSSGACGPGGQSIFSDAATPIGRGCHRRQPAIGGGGGGWWPQHCLPFIQNFVASPPTAISCPKIDHRRQFLADPKVAGKWRIHAAAFSFLAYHSQRCCANVSLSIKFKCDFQRFRYVHSNSVAVFHFGKEVTVDPT